MSIVLHRRSGATFLRYFARMVIMLAQTCVGFPTNFDSFAFYLTSLFKNVAPTNGFSNIFDLALNPITSCISSTCTKSWQCSFLHIFPMYFDGFRVNASGLHFRQVTNLATVLSQHVALSGAYVPEITLCVTFGAPCSGTTFRVLMR